MFYPVTGDLYRDNVVLHLPMTGANDGTTFTDVSPTPKTITRYNALTKTAVSKWGQGSGYFDGTSDYLESPNSSDFAFANSVFAIEAWIYPTTVSSMRAICSQRNSIGTSGWVFWVRDTAKLGFAAANTASGSWVDLNSLTSIQVNVWTHVVVSYDGTTLRLFINGVLDNSTTSFTGTQSNSTTPFYVGRDRQSNTTRDWTGYLQDLRITKGVARYTADFVVPVGPLPFRSPEVPIHRPIIQPHPFHQIARVGL